MSCIDLDGTPQRGCWVYICPQSGEDECVVHGGFSTCCAHPQCPSKSDLGQRAKARKGEVIWHEGSPIASSPDFNPGDQ